jgi:hypothetical protein
MTETVTWRSDWRIMWNVSKRREMLEQGFWENLEARNHLADAILDGRIILKCNLMK